MQRTLVSLSGLVVAVLSVGVVADASANGILAHHTPAHIQVADGKGPTDIHTSTPATVTRAVGV